MKKFLYPSILSIFFAAGASYACVLPSTFCAPPMQEDEEAVCLLRQKHAFTQDLISEKAHMGQFLNKIKQVTTPETLAGIESCLGVIARSQTLEEATHYFCSILSLAMGDIQTNAHKTAGFELASLPTAPFPHHVDVEKLNARKADFAFTLELTRAAYDATSLMTLLCDGARRQAFYLSLEQKYENQKKKALKSALSSGEIPLTEITFKALASDIGEISPALGDSFALGSYLSPSFLAECLLDHFIELNDHLHYTKDKIQKMVLPGPSLQKLAWIAKMEQEEQEAQQEHLYAYAHTHASEKQNMIEFLRKIKGATLYDTPPRIELRIASIRQSKNMPEATAAFLSILTTAMGDIQKDILARKNYEGPILPDSPLPEQVDMQKLHEDLAYYAEALRYLQTAPRAGQFLTLLCDGAQRKAAFQRLSAKFDHLEAEGTMAGYLASGDMPSQEFALMTMEADIDGMSIVLGEYFRTGRRLAPSFLARMYKEYLYSLDDTLERTRQALRAMVMPQPKILG